MRPTGGMNLDALGGECELDVGGGEGVADEERARPVGARHVLGETLVQVAEVGAQISLCDIGRRVSAEVRTLTRGRDAEGRTERLDEVGSDVGRRVRHEPVGVHDRESVEHCLSSSISSRIEDAERDRSQRAATYSTCPRRKRSRR